MHSNLIFKISYTLLLLISFSISFTHTINTVLIILFVLSFLGDLIINHKAPKISNRPVILLLIIFLLLNFVSYFFSEDKDYSLVLISMKISILVFLIGFNFIEFTNLQKQNILKSFVYGNFLAIIFCILNAIIKSTSFVDGELIFNTVVLQEKNLTFWKSLTWGGNYFAYTELSMFMHPTYFAMNLVFSLAMIYKFFSDKLFLKNEKIIFTVSSVIFIIFIMMLSSRAGILSLLMVLAFIVFHLFMKSRRLIVKIMPIFIIAAGIFLILLNPRFKELTNFDKLKNKETHSGAALRVLVWENSFEIIRENFWFGVGNGDANDALYEKYIQNEITKAEAKKLNAHNQYLQTFIETGIFGFISLILILLIPLINAVRKKNLLLILLICIIGFNFIFESMLSRFSGVLFFAFFYNLLIFANAKNIEETTLISNKQS